METLCVRKLARGHLHRPNFAVRPVFLKFKMPDPQRGVGKRVARAHHGSVKNWANQWTIEIFGVPRRCFFFEMSSSTPGRQRYQVARSGS